MCCSKRSGIAAGTFNSSRKNKHDRDSRSHQQGHILTALGPLRPSRKKELMRDADGQDETKTALTKSTNESILCKGHTYASLFRCMGFMMTIWCQKRGSEPNWLDISRGPGWEEVGKRAARTKTQRGVPPPFPVNQQHNHLWKRGVPPLSYVRP